MSDPLHRARELTAHFRATLRTVHLATVSADGTPDASVPAALLDDTGAFVIYVSGLAAHTRNLAANSRASVLLTADESAVANPFARPRLTFACTAAPVARDSADFTKLLAAFREKFGATVDLLSSLPDFRFIRLVPASGRLVAGFGETYEVSPHDWSQLTPFRPRG